MAPVSSEFRRQSCGSRAGAAAKIPAALQQLSSPRPSLGLSLSLCPIWRCLSLQTLWGASVQDRAWHEMTGEEENPLHVHLRLRAGSEGQRERQRPGFSQLGYFCTKTRVLSVEVQHSQPPSSLPRAGCGPGDPPQKQQSSAKRLQARGAQKAPVAGISPLSVPPMPISLAIAESLVIVLAEGFVSLLPSKFPGI